MHWTGRTWGKCRCLRNNLREHLIKGRVTKQQRPRTTDVHRNYWGPPPPTYTGITGTPTTDAHRNYGDPQHWLSQELLGTPTTDSYRNYGPTGRRWIHGGDYLLWLYPDFLLGFFLSCLFLSLLSLFPRVFE